MQTLIDYAYNRNENTAFKLASFYEDNEQLAAAISYYLESAELSIYEFTQYESLIRAALCFEKQGNRIHTSLDLLYKAVALLPERYEAPFHLIRILNLMQQYHQAYSIASIYTRKYTVGQVPLIRTDYEGIHAIEFEGGLAAWWIGFIEEAKSTMYKLTKHSSFMYSQLAARNLRSIGYPKEAMHYSPGKFQLRFNNSNLVKTNYAQTYQDLFPLTELNGKNNGTYLEIGCADPIICNNTYLLEKTFGWTGISIDIEAHHISKFKLERKNTAICADATKIDYTQLLSNMPEVIDYLQVDCEPPAVSFDILKKILTTNKIFNTITFEHDSYLAGDEIKNESRKLLEKDYVLVVPDVRFDAKGIFEDWWAHKSVAKRTYTSMEEYFGMTR
jgi:tetratricopeptide (TPR) repeat protein